MKLTKGMLLKARGIHHYNNCDDSLRVLSLLDMGCTNLQRSQNLDELKNVSKQHA